MDKQSPTEEISIPPEGVSFLMPEDEMAVIITIRRPAGAYAIRLDRNKKASDLSAMDERELSIAAGLIAIAQRRVDEEWSNRPER